MAVATYTYTMSKTASGEANSGNNSCDKEVPDCPTCGKGGFKSKKYMKIHHTHAHGESLKGEAVDCSYCGETFRKQPNQIEAYDHHFCSDDCHGNWRSEQYTGEDHPNYKGGKPEFECGNCGETFKRWVSQTRDYDNNFCSWDCKTEYETGREMPELQGERIECSCDYCGKEFERPPARANQYKHQYCSRECADKAHSKRMSGDGNTNWQGGEYDGKYYGPNWQKQRNKARERDDYECQLCGAQENEFPHELDVHHKEKWRTFDDYKEANKLDNLITLCRVCHGKVERWPVQPQ